MHILLHFFFFLWESAKAALWFSQEPIAYERWRTSASAYPESIANTLSHFHSLASSSHQNLKPVTTSRMPSLTTLPITDFSCFPAEFKTNSFCIYHILLRSHSLNKYTLGTYYVCTRHHYTYLDVLASYCTVRRGMRHLSIQYASCFQGHVAVLAPLNGNKNEQWHFCGLAFSPKRACKTRLMIFCFSF